MSFAWSTFPGGNWQGTDLAFDRTTNRLYGEVGGQLISLRPQGRHDLRVLADAGGAHRMLGPDHRVHWVDGHHLRSVDGRDAD